MKKPLWVSIDYIDNILRSQRHYTPDDLEAMMKYIASIGATNVQWIMDTAWTFYDADTPGGFDLIKEACCKAHSHGLTFHVVFKPFEGAFGGATTVLPDGIETDKDSLVLHEFGCMLHGYRPSVSKYHEMNLTRNANDSNDPGGNIAAIRLIKNDNTETGINPGDLSLWISTHNGGYKKYDGPVQLSECSGWRMIFPYHDTPYRIITLSGLKLPADIRFILIKREQDGEPFTNVAEQMIELVNEHYQIIPSTPALRNLDPQKLYKSFEFCTRLGLTRFARQPLAQKIVRDKEKFLSLCQGMSRFDDVGWENAHLVKGSDFAVARGVARQRSGQLHPIYPEVCQDWLEQIQFCIDRGVDGVNIRLGNHHSIYQPYYFGFNPPVMERMSHSGNFAEAAKINGDAYTQFLRLAAELLHAHGKKMGEHVHGQMLHHDDRAANSYVLPRIFQWQWETWIQEFADYIEYRDAAIFRPENQRILADRIGLAARQAGIPMVYQSMRGHMVNFDPPHSNLAHEMDWVRQHPDVSTYNLYEVDNFSHYQPERGFVGSSSINELIQNHWLTD